MSQFKYTLPSGAEFVVRGPAGATQAQADRIFYEQVAAGSLINYAPGQTLTSGATVLTTFELSRLERGTAGVTGNPFLAIAQGLPVTAGTLNNLASLNDSVNLNIDFSGFTVNSLVATIQDLPQTPILPSLTDVAIANPVTQADIVNIKGDSLGPNAVGPLSAFQVQTLLAQLAKLVDQAADEITREKGAGLYGMTAYQLEIAGYVKPGTSLRFLSLNPEDFVSVMNSPGVWTGKNGIYSLPELLSDPDAQTSIQNELMQNGYDGLTAAGVIRPPQTRSVSFSTGQVYTQGGLQTISALTLLGGGLNPSISGIVRNALSGTSTLSKLLTTPITNLTSIGSGAVTSLLSGTNNLAALNFNSAAQVLTKKITGDVGALITNASKFGTQATALWAQAGNLSFESLGSNFTSIAGSGLSNLAGGLTGSVNQIAGQLTNLVPGSLGNLTSQLDIFGKGSQFALNLANPLSSFGSLGDLGGISNLASGALNNLTGSASALTGQLTGALSGQLSGLTGQLSGALSGQLAGLTGALSGQLSGALSGVLGNLGGLANLGSLGGLFGGGGDLVSGTQVAAGFSNTVNRKTVDLAVSKVIGNSKIPTPRFEYPSLASLAPRLDIQQAFNFLRIQPSASGGTFGQTVTI